MPTPANFEFLTYPKIVSGQCALENIPSELDGYDAHRPLLITGRRVAQQGLLSKFIRAFYDSTCTIGAAYDDVLDYAGISQAREVALLFHERNCDSVIALGNGPVVDLAKTVNVLVSEQNTTLRPNREGTLISGPLKPMILVPGGVFNGWEVSHTMTVDNRRVTSDFLYPDVVVLDSRIVTGASAEEMAQSAAMTLLQAVAALTSDQPNPMLDALAHPALELLSKHLVDALEAPHAKTHALALANAAVMAGAAYANLQPTLAHLLAEALCALGGVSTGKLIPILLATAIADSSPRDELCLAAAGMEVFSKLAQDQRSRKGAEMILTHINHLKKRMFGTLQTSKLPYHVLPQAAKEVSIKSEGRYPEETCLALLTQTWENGEGIIV